MKCFLFRIQVINFVMHPISISPISMSPILFLDTFSYMIKYNLIRHLVKTLCLIPAIHYFSFLFSLSKSCFKHFKAFASIKVCTFHHTVIKMSTLLQFPYKYFNNKVFLPSVINQDPNDEISCFLI